MEALCTMENTNGAWHGNGTRYYKNGDVYKGEWSANKRQGRGVMTYANGDIYKTRAAALETSVSEASVNESEGGRPRTGP
eukprot:scaffold6210_cov143-Skeletonema_menzelii.AAC.1